MRIFEHIECETIRVGSEFACVGKDIKSSLRLYFYFKSHFPKPGNHIPATFVIDVFHPFHIRICLP